VGTSPQPGRRRCSDATIPRIAAETTAAEPARAFRGGCALKIAIAADHAGFELKQVLAAHVRGLGHDVVDLGTDGPESVDYPDFGAACGRAGCPD